jgi:hypothetical protein
MLSLNRYTGYYWAWGRWLTFSLAVGGESVSSVLEIAVHLHTVKKNLVAYLPQVMEIGLLEGGVHSASGLRQQP